MAPSAKGDARSKNHSPTASQHRETLSIRSAERHHLQTRADEWRAKIVDERGDLRRAHNSSRRIDSMSTFRSNSGPVVIGTLVSIAACSGPDSGSAPPLGTKDASAGGMAGSEEGGREAASAGAGGMAGFDDGGGSRIRGWTGR
jgi:hypothetical protein